MNTIELKDKTKTKIDELFSEIDDFKIKSDRVKDDLKSDWDNTLQSLESKKENLMETYKKISDANDEAAKELAQSFEEQWKTAEGHLSHIRELYSKTLN